MISSVSFSRLMSQQGEEKAGNVVRSTGGVLGRILSGTLQEEENAGGDRLIQRLKYSPFRLRKLTTPLPQNFSEKKKVVRPSFDERDRELCGDGGRHGLL